MEVAQYDIRVYSVSPFSVHRDMFMQAEAYLDFMDQLTHDSMFG